VTFTFWYIVIGLLLVGMALSGGLLKRLPLTTSMLYLGLGVVLGPMGLGMIRLDPLDGAALLERASEVAVIISLFAAGLKLSTVVPEANWWLPARLAIASMGITVGLIAVAGVWLLGLPFGAAVLLGAVIAPTDPVLASDVQVEHFWDRDRLRFSLTGEAGMNDGTAFPFVMLGLGLLGLHDLGPVTWKWWTVDVLWGTIGGLGVGAITGWGVGRLVVHLRRKWREAVGSDEYLALGLLAAAYGLALLLHTYGFLAAFAAGLALRRVASASSADTPLAQAPVAAGAGAARHEVGLQHVPAQMAQAVLGFHEQLERTAEVALVLLIGGMLTVAYLPRESLWFVPLVLLGVRPAAVLLGLVGSGVDWMQRGLICWFGIRGIGSLYYLMYAVTHGLPRDQAKLLTGLTLSLIAASIVVHGLSVTPLMTLYRRVRLAASTRSDARAARKEGHFDQWLLPSVGGVLAFITGTTSWI
jgi:NhaP-type Na+/H+ or K+/H+ antiporter